MFHFIPFLAGAAAGAAITYVVKDRETRSRIREGADKVTEGVRDGIERAARAGKALVRSSSERTHRDADSDISSTTH